MKMSLFSVCALIVLSLFPATPIQAHDPTDSVATAKGCEYLINTLNKLHGHVITSVTQCREFQDTQNSPYYKWVRAVVEFKEYHNLESCAGPNIGCLQYQNYDTNSSPTSTGYYKQYTPGVQTEVNIRTWENNFRTFSNWRPWLTYGKYYGGFLGPIACGNLNSQVPPHWQPVSDWSCQSELKDFKQCTDLACGSQAQAIVPHSFRLRLAIELPFYKAVVPKVTLSSSQNPVKRGIPFQLKWGSTNATKLEIDQGIGVVPPPNGQKELTINQSTIYKITATSKDGITREASVEVRIAEEKLPDLAISTTNIGYSLDEAVKKPLPAIWGTNSGVSLNIEDIEVTNKGTMSVNGFSATATLGMPDSSSPLTTEEEFQISLAPGESKKISLQFLGTENINQLFANSFLYASTLSLPLKITLDPKNTIRELSESNNDVVIENSARAAALKVEVVDKLGQPKKGVNVATRSKFTEYTGITNSNGIARFVPTVSPLGEDNWVEVKVSLGGLNAAPPRTIRIKDTGITNTKIVLDNEGIALLVVPVAKTEAPGQYDIVRLADSGQVTIRSKKTEEQITREIDGGIVFFPSDILEADTDYELVQAKAIRSINGHSYEFIYPLEEANYSIPNPLPRNTSRPIKTTLGLPQKCNMDTETKINLCIVDSKKDLTDENILAVSKTTLPIAKSMKSWQQYPTTRLQEIAIGPMHYYGWFDTASGTSVNIRDRLQSGEQVRTTLMHEIFHLADYQYSPTGSDFLSQDPAFSSSITKELASDGGGGFWDSISWGCAYSLVSNCGGYSALALQAAQIQSTEALAEEWTTFCSYKGAQQKLNAQPENEWKQLTLLRLAGKDAEGNSRFPQFSAWQEQCRKELGE